MYCSNDLGRGASTRPENVTTLSAIPSSKSQVSTTFILIVNHTFYTYIRQ